MPHATRCQRPARPSSIALICALIGALGAPASNAQQAAPAPAAAPALQVAQTVRAEFATPINAAQSLLGQGQLDEAMRNVALAAALPKLTPYETMLVERTRAAIAQRQGNNALVVQALEAALATGQIPQADEVGLVEAVVSIASRLNDHPRVLRWTERYAALGGTQDAVRMVRIQSQLASGDDKGAMAALAARLDAADKAGQTPPESHLRTLLSLQQKLKDGGLQRTLERLAVAYPRPEYWMDLVVTAARDPAIPDRTLIEMYRLLRVVGGVKQLELAKSSRSWRRAWASRPRPCRWWKTPSLPARWARAARLRRINPCAIRCASKLRPKPLTAPLPRPRPGRRPMATDWWTWAGPWWPVCPKGLRLRRWSRGWP